MEVFSFIGILMVLILAQATFIVIVALAQLMSDGDSDGKFFVPLCVCIIILDVVLALFIVKPESFGYQKIVEIETVVEVEK